LPFISHVLLSTNSPHLTLAIFILLYIICDV
jgi:hypothetical protein